MSNRILFYFKKNKVSLLKSKIMGVGKITNTWLDSVAIHSDLLIISILFRKLEISKSCFRDTLYSSQKPFLVRVTYFKIIRKERYK